MSKEAKTRLARNRRHARVRLRVFGTPERPRLNVFRSLNHIYAQVIDDSRGHTLAAASTNDPKLREQVKGMTRSEQARAVGKAVAERARAVGVTMVVFDRAGYPYHGRVQALAEGSREGGLQF